ncbi:fluoride efflux transporter FluC [Actinomyces vulturis]|uniref:fluoride efflux transporter FluC n=1 Tax=Actinomyces vulturis TaxID=1857645 RepID=UPI00083100F0|nr:CrcB family protein [Actinomyces vulturis]
MTILIAGLIGASASLGCISRLWVDSWVKVLRRHLTSKHSLPAVIDFPWGTLTVNIVGSFLLGMLVGAHGVPHWITLVIGTGFLGGFTTFSTAMLDAVTQVIEKRTVAGASALVMTAVASIAACALGMALTC